MTDRNDPPKIYTTLDYPQAFEKVKNTLALCPIGTRGFWQIRACDPQQSIIQAAMSFSGYVNSAFPDARANIIMDIVFGFASGDIGVSDGTVYIKLKFSVFGFPLPLGVEQAIDMTTGFLTTGLTSLPKPGYDEELNMVFEKFKNHGSNTAWEKNEFYAIQDVCVRLQTYYPDRIEAYILEANLFLEVNNYGVASRLFEKTIKHFPDSAEGYYGLGGVLIRMSDYNNASICFSKALKIDKYMKDAYFMRGTAKFELQDYHGAVADFTKAIELNPNDAEAYQKRGETKEKLGDKMGATYDFIKAGNFGKE